MLHYSKQMKVIFFHHHIKYIYFLLLLSVAVFFFFGCFFVVVFCFGGFDGVLNYGKIITQSLAHSWVYGLYAKNYPWLYLL